MKVKALGRARADCVRANSGDLRRVHRNLNPSAHPLRRAREHARAVTAAKLDRMFAAPFVGDLGEGHRDAVTCLATSRTALTPLVSGGADGEVRVWDLQSRREVRTIPTAHAGAVTGVAVVRNRPEALSVGTDGRMRRWDMVFRGDNGDDEDDHRPSSTWSSPGDGGPFKSIDCHWTRDGEVATARDGGVDLWNLERDAPVRSFEPGRAGWGDDTVHAIRYNPAETDLLAFCSLDRGVGLFDARVGAALRKTVMTMRANVVEWNPMEPMRLVVANEDHNLYGFDMRNLAKPIRVHRGHVGAVLDVSWSPTGREFVSGSYDRTIRIFEAESPTSRDCYHTKRMQRVFAVARTADDAFVVSGSDDSNLRLWKAKASAPLHRTTAREERALEYRAALVDRYRHMPEVSRVVRSTSKRVPKLVRKQTAAARLQLEKQERKTTNRIKHSKPGTVVPSSQRERAVVREVK